MAAVMTASATSLSAFAATPKISFTTNENGTMTVQTDGSGANSRVAIAQYDSKGILVNLGISSIGGNSATTTGTYNTNPLYKTNVYTFNDWSKFSSSELGYSVGSKTIAVEDFENGHSMTPHANNQVQDFDYSTTDRSGNATKALHMAKNVGADGDSHATVKGITPDTDFVVYQFDIQLLSNENYVNAVIIHTDTSGSQKDSTSLLKTKPIDGDTTKCTATMGTNTATMDVNKWYTASFVANYKDHEGTYYLSDGTTTTVVGTGTISTNAGIHGELYAPSGLRFHQSKYTGKDINTWDYDYLVDNIKVYEGTEPKDEINDIVNVVDVDESKTVFDSEDTEIALLDGTYTVHARSGVAYHNGEKTLLENSPYTDDDGTVHVPLAELCTAWGVTPTGITADSEGYVKLEELAAVLGMTVYTDSNIATNNGINVLSASSFTFPTNEDDAQALNEFAFYYRPSTDEVKADYANSSVKGQHPRIMGTKSDFDRIRGLYTSNSNAQFTKWANNVISSANNYLTAPQFTKGYTSELVSYDDYFGYRVNEGRITTSTEHLPYAAFTLGMAYQMTGNKAYADKLYYFMETVMDYPNWNPTHHLDPAEIGIAMAVGYDWCYDAFTNEQRENIETSIYNNLFYDASLSYKSTSSAMNNSAVATNNHNIVCNGGIAVAALAMMDAYPSESAYLLKNAIRAVDIMMYHWAPSGSWYEGVSYWNLTMEYTVYMLSSLESVLGTNYGLDTCEGLSDASKFMIYSQTNIGPHNYSDCAMNWLVTDLYTPEMLWLSQRYNDSGVTQAVMKYAGNSLKNSQDNALALLWYDTSITSNDVSLPLDMCYESDNVAALRNNWNQDDTSSYVGIHGGITNTDHSQIDGGSYVYEWGGVRWAVDPGWDNYNVPGYWDTDFNSATNRWKYFHSQAASHNTVEIDPSSSKTGHSLDSVVDVKLIETNSDGAIVTADMSQALKNDASSAKRGFFYTDNRQSLVIRDEITLKNTNSTVHWYLMTGNSYDTTQAATITAEVKTEGSTQYVLLTDIDSQKQVRVDFVVSGRTMQLKCENAETVRQSLMTQGIVADESNASQKSYADNGLNRVELKLTGSGNVTITAKLTPVGISGTTSVSDYDKAISSWSLN